MSAKHSNNQPPLFPLTTYVCRVAALSCEEKTELKERISHDISQEGKD